MTEKAVKPLQELQTRIDYHFVDKQLLQRALTHRSAEKAANGIHLERLEFLGDAVLGLVISAYLHERYPDKPEGDLSRMRSVLVRKQGLQTVAQAWHLDLYLCVGESERVGAGRRGVKSPSIVANAVEAVIGAVFEDGGWEPAHRLVKRAWQAQLVDIGDMDTSDAKSRLQEWTQAKGWGLPAYELIDLGFGASPRFQATCSVNGELLGRGVGERKKLAEIEAAEQAYRKLNA